MASGAKKISFGFSKISKKHEKPKYQSDSVQLIDCLEGQAIKVIGGDLDSDVKKPLVIPLKNKTVTAASLLNLPNDVNTNPPIRESGALICIRPQIKPVKDTFQGVLGSANDVPSVKNDKNHSDLKNQSLESLAASEIIADLNSDTKKIEAKIFTVPLTGEKIVSLDGEKEPTLDDYENIPISDYGMAMLRGMGWKPTKQTILNLPPQRPKGMGLGADRPAQMPKKNIGKKPGDKEEELKINKGSYVKVVMGKHKGAYGQIEGLDDDAGRLFVKMAIGGIKLSLNEFMVQPVTKTEYERNSKVLNSAKYDEYKNRENLNQDEVRLDKKSDVTYAQEHNVESRSPMRDNQNTSLGPMDNPAVSRISPKREKESRSRSCSKDRTVDESATPSKLAKDRSYSPHDGTRIKEKLSKRDRRERSRSRSCSKDRTVNESATPSKLAKDRSYSPNDGTRIKEKLSKRDRRERSRSKKRHRRSRSRSKSRDKDSRGQRKQLKYRDTARHDDDYEGKRRNRSDRERRDRDRRRSKSCDEKSIRKSMQSSRKNRSPSSDYGTRYRNNSVSPKRTGKESDSKVNKEYKDTSMSPDGTSHSKDKLSKQSNRTLSSSPEIKIKKDRKGHHVKEKKHKKDRSRERRRK